MKNTVADVFRNVIENMALCYDGKEIPVDISAIAVRLQTYNLYMDTPRCEHVVRWIEEAPKLIAAPLSTDDLISEVVKLAKAELHLDIYWNGWQWLNDKDKPPMLHHPH